MDAQAPLEYAIPMNSSRITREETADGVWFSMRPGSIVGPLLAAVIVIPMILLIAYGVARMTMDAVFDQGFGWTAIKLALFEFVLLCLLGAAARGIYLLVSRRHIVPAVGIENGVLIAITPRQTTLRQELSLKNVKDIQFERSSFSSHRRLSVTPMGLLDLRVALPLTANERELRPVQRELSALLFAYKAAKASDALKHGVADS